MRCFNPRTHMGCDRDGQREDEHPIVSIHAPTWGATWTNSSPSGPTGFNPRTHMGCDRISVLSTSNSACFNPRTHMGCDGYRPSTCKGRRVSIHAPTWGATDSPSPCFLSVGFNPRTHMGCDLLTPKTKQYAGSFNPRTHMGCDRRTQAHRLHHPCFNPRTHMGCDIMLSVFDEVTNVSIHAPTWGATYRDVHVKDVQNSFNPRTHMGCDQTSCTIPKHWYCFNPRTHMGCDLTSGAMSQDTLWFQSTHPHGVRLG